MDDQASAVTQRRSGAQKLISRFMPGFAGGVLDQQVQDLLSGLALNVLTTLGRIDPEIFVREPNGKQLKLREDLEPGDVERARLLQQALALVTRHPEASEALSRGHDTALRAWRKGGWPATVYEIRVDALSTLETGKPFYRFRVVGKEAPDLKQWQAGFIPQYVLKQARGRGPQIPALMDERSGLVFTKVGITCHDFGSNATLAIIPSWINDCCKFNGYNGTVQKASDPTKMKCKI